MKSADIDKQLQELGKRHRALQAPAGFAKQLKLRKSQVRQWSRALPASIAISAALAVAILYRPQSDAPFASGTKSMPGLSALAMKSSITRPALASSSEIRSVSVPGRPQASGLSRYRDKTSGQ